MFIDSLGGRQGSDEVVVVVKCVCGNDRKSGEELQNDHGEVRLRGSFALFACDESSKCGSSTSARQRGSSRSSPCYFLLHPMWCKTLLFSAHPRQSD